MQSAAIFRKSWSAVTTNVRRFARSPWMSAAAAITILLGTAGTYVAGNITADAQICDFRRELLIANGSPDLHAGRDVSYKLAEAQTYLTLALSTRDIDQRREYSFLGVTAANIAILSTPTEADTQIEIFRYPTNSQLESLRYMSSLVQDVNNLDVTQLTQTLKVHDQNLAKHVAELASCDDRANVGGAIGAVAVLFTLLSLMLIGFREYHQSNMGKRSRK